MQDKSSYTNPNKPQISDGLQNFINAMVEEIVLKGEAFDEQKKKWLKKYSEAEGIDYHEIEKRLGMLLIAIDIKKDYSDKKMTDLILNLSSVCLLHSDFSKKIISQIPNHTQKANVTPEQFNELLLELDSMRHQVKVENNTNKLIKEENEKLIVENKNLKQQVISNYNWARELESKLNSGMTKIK
jgi:hypothetical protein